jgi:biopolymer transport protein ExbB/TolQ
MEKAAAFRAAVSLYWAEAWELVAKHTQASKVLAALLVLVVVASYAHQLGAAGKSDLKAQVAQLKQQLADAEARPAPQPEIPADESAAEQANQRAGELAARLSESESAKAKLQQKVNDYEKQLARRPAKAGAFTLSPADARSLSNF